MQSPHTNMYHTKICTTEQFLQKYYYKTGLNKLATNVTDPWKQVSFPIPVYVQWNPSNTAYTFKEGIHTYRDPYYSQAKMNTILLHLMYSGIAYP